MFKVNNKDVSIVNDFYILIFHIQKFLKWEESLCKSLPIYYYIHYYHILGAVSNIKQFFYLTTITIYKKEGCAMGTKCAPSYDIHLWVGLINILSTL